MGKLCIANHLRLLLSAGAAILFSILMQGRIRAQDQKLESPSQFYDNAYQKLVFPQLNSPDDEPTDEYLEKLRKFLQGSKLNTLERYVASRRLAGYFQEETRIICKQIQPKADDYRFRSACIIADSRLTYSEKKDLGRSLLNQVGQLEPRSELQVRMAVTFADLATEQNDSSWALVLLEKALESTHSKELYFRVKGRLGSLYSNELNKPETIQKAIDYLIESEAFWRQSKLVENADFSLYVIATTLIRSRQDYAEAIRYLNRITLPVEGSHALKFAYQALAAMKLNNQKLMRESLEQFNKVKLDSSSYSHHALCLIQIVRYRSFGEQNLSSCIAKPDEELGLHTNFISRELSQLALSKDAEQMMWKQYQRFMETKVVPGLQMAFEQGTNEIEVETARMEALLQKEKAQNLEQYEHYSKIMLLFSIGLCLLLGLLVWFFRDLQKHHAQLAEKKKEIEELNKIIAAENISIQKAMRLEIESKFNLASDAAHRLNNPLNYIHVGAELLLQKARIVAKEIQDLFATADQDDPETKLLMQHFQSHLNEAETAATSIRLGVGKAIESVMEIRGLAGVDGYKVESLPLLQIIEEAISRLADHLGPDVADYISFQSSDWTTLRIEGDRYLMKNALEIFLRDLVEQDNKSLRLSLGHETKPQNLAILVQGLKVVSTESAHAIEDRLNHLLRNLHIQVRIALAPGQVTMSWSNHKAFLIGSPEESPTPLKQAAGGSRLG